MKLEAMKLRSGRYVVRPAGALGTCGWIDGKPWTAKFVNAGSEAEAIRKATKGCKP